MTTTRPRQLELPVLANVNGKVVPGSACGAPAEFPVGEVSAGFHKPASADDRSVYKSISDNYFGTTAKRA